MHNIQCHFKESVTMRCEIHLQILSFNVQLWYYLQTDFWRHLQPIQKWEPVMPLAAADNAASWSTQECR